MGSSPMEAPNARRVA